MPQPPIPGKLTLPSLSAPKHPSSQALAGVGDEDGQCRRPLPIVGKGGGRRPTPEKGRHRPAQRESERVTGERKALMLESAVLSHSSTVGARTY